MEFMGNRPSICCRRHALRLLLLAATAAVRPAAGGGQARPAPADAMEPEHYVRSLEVTLATDPVPKKGTFLFTARSGRASVAYQMRSGQGGELTVVAECSRHGRFETKRRVRDAAA